MVEPLALLSVEVELHHSQPEPWELEEVDSPLGPLGWPRDLQPREYSPLGPLGWPRELQARAQAAETYFLFQPSLGRSNSRCAAFCHCWDDDHNGDRKPPQLVAYSGGCKYNISVRENTSINLNYLQVYSRNLFIELTMLKPAKGLRGNSAAGFRLAPQLDASWVGPLAVLDAPFCVRRLPPQLLALSGQYLARVYMNLWTAGQDALRLPCLAARLDGP